MIDYKTYQKVLDFVKWNVQWEPTPEVIASAICGLFDTKTVATPFTYGDKLIGNTWPYNPPTPIPCNLNRVTCSNEYRDESILKDNPNYPNANWRYSHLLSQWYITE